MRPPCAERGSVADDFVRRVRRPYARAWRPVGIEVIRLAILVGTILVLGRSFLVLGTAAQQVRSWWPVNHATASPERVDVKVEGGRAWWHWDDTHSETDPALTSRRLVVVSTLAREGGPFPLRLSLRTAATTREARAPSKTVAPPMQPVVVAPGRWPIRDERLTLDDRVTRLEAAAPPRPKRPPLPLRRFWIPDGSGRYADPSAYRAVATRLGAFDDHIQVYVDEEDLHRVTSETLSDLIDTFSRRIEPAARLSLGLGTPYDLDGDGRFTVVMSCKLENFGGGTEPLEGFIRAADFDQTLPAPLSNHADLLWMSAGLSAGPRLRSILAHEYTHVLVLCRKVLDRRHKGLDGLEEESWLNEAMAHWVESRHGFSWENLDYRVSAFLSRPEAYRLVVPDDHAAGLFRGHGNRGAAFLFYRWLTERFGEDLLGRIARCPEPGIAALEQLLGWSFDDLFRAWGMDLFLDGLDPWELEGSRGGLDLRDRIADWPLAGPRFTRLDPLAQAGVARHSWESQPTTHTFFVVEPNPGGSTFLDLESPPEAMARVAILNLPQGWRPLDVTATTAESSQRNANGTTGPETLWVEVARNGSGLEPPTRLRSLSWEPLVPRANTRAMTFRCGGGTWSAPSGSRLAQPPAIRDRRPRIATFAAPLLEPDQSLIIKAVGLDHQGRRVVGWAEWRAEVGGECSRPGKAVNN